MPHAVLTTWEAPGSWLYTCAWSAHRAQPAQLVYSGALMVFHCKHWHGYGALLPSCLAAAGQGRRPHSSQSHAWPAPHTSGHEQQLQAKLPQSLRKACLHALAHLLCGCTSTHKHRRQSPLPFIKSSTHLVLAGQVALLRLSGMTDGGTSMYYMRIQSMLALKGSTHLVLAGQVALPPAPVVLLVLEHELTRAQDGLRAFCSSRWRGGGMTSGPERAWPWAQARGRGAAVHCELWVR